MHGRSYKFICAKLGLIVGNKIINGRTVILVIIIIRIIKKTGVTIRIVLIISLNKEVRSRSSRPFPLICQY